MGIAVIVDIQAEGQHRGACSPIIVVWDIHLIRIYCHFKLTDSSVDQFKNHRAQPFSSPEQCSFHSLATSCTASASPDSSDTDRSTVTWADSRTGALAVNASEHERAILAATRVLPDRPEEMMSHVQNDPRENRGPKPYDYTQASHDLHITLGKGLVAKYS